MNQKTCLLFHELAHELQRIFKEVLCAGSDLMKLWCQYAKKWEVFQNAWDLTVKYFQKNSSEGF